MRANCSYIALVVLVCSTACALLPEGGDGDTDAMQPPQPIAGPGGSDYAHGDWRVSTGGEGVYGWYVFEPIDPQPVSAPLAIVMHGYSDFDGYDMMSDLIRHTVRKGRVVIYPRWQTGLFSPCAGSLDIEPCMTSSIVGIRGALDYLAGAEDRVQPERDKASYFGFSFGGIIAANLANRHAALGLPVPRAIFLDDLHDGGFAGLDEPGLDDSLVGIPADVKLQCHVGAEGIVALPSRNHSSCNALFPKLGHIPDANKDLVLTHTDRHGTPVLSSKHGVSTGRAGTIFEAADAYDWNFVWKVWDALQSCAYDGVDCEYALGDTPEHRAMGQWSDGVSVQPLVIQKSAPIAP